MRRDASANPLKPGARRRGKSSVLEARWLYLDADEDDDLILSRVDADAAAGRIPAPTAVINTSPGLYQILWRIEPTDTSKTEAMPRGLAITTDRNGRRRTANGFCDCRGSGRASAACPCGWCATWRDLRRSWRTSPRNLPFPRMQGLPGSPVGRPANRDQPKRPDATAGTERNRGRIGLGLASNRYWGAGLRRSRRNWRHAVWTSRTRPPMPA